jgi:D-alanyl-D-alanine carboxypeptidase
MVKVLNFMTRLREKYARFSTPESVDKIRSKKKLVKIPSALLISIVITGIFFISWRTNNNKHGNTTQELEEIVKNLISENKQIKNCVLYVAKGDGSFTWSGMAGIANQAGQIPMTKETPIYLASITKIYIAVAVMKLYELGSLSLDEPISKYLPQDLIHGLNVFQGQDYSNEITIEQLLSHKSGIPDYYDEKGKNGKSLFEIFKEDQHQQWRVEDQIAWVRNNLISKSMPGEEAFYSDTNYQLLGKIIEARTGKPLHTVLSELLFIPLSLKHSWLVSDPFLLNESSRVIADVFSGEENITRMRSSTFYWADGGLVATTEDEIMFLKALKEGRIIKPATLEMMHHWNPIKNSGPFEYGFGTMEINIPSVDVLPVWGHSGSLGSFLYYSPSTDLYIAGTINQTNESRTALQFMIRALQVISRL